MLFLFTPIEYELGKALFYGLSQIKRRCLWNLGKSFYTWRGVEILSRRDGVCDTSIHVHTLTLICSSSPASATLFDVQTQFFPYSSRSKTMLNSLKSCGNFAYWQFFYVKIDFVQMAACQITIFDLAAVLAQRVALLTRHTLNCSKHGARNFYHRTNLL